ncbi:Imm1 family immunity protein [Streptomyces sp. NPDC002514]|uniref:Imm1 family immunity protein n=1 Tax=Streptomyces sp. NPDC001270 TaxID=3364554 RepID=UPI0036A89121
MLKVLGHEPLYLRTDRELKDYLDEIFAEDRAGSYFNAHVQVVTGETEDVDNLLAIGLDYDSGYGALSWHCTGKIEERVNSVAGADMANYVWVSWNPVPPEVDPEIVSDPWSPSYFNRVSAIPLSDVRSAVEEYYREGSGFRPSAVQWVKGNFTGELLDEGTENRQL